MLRPNSRASAESVLFVPDDEWTWQQALQSLACDLLDTSAVVRAAALDGEEDLPATPRSRAHPFAERLLAAEPASGMDGRLDWSRLLAVQPSEALAAAEQPGAEAKPVRRRAQRLEINSGGEVFFGLLAPAKPRADASEEAVAVKFCNSRHTLQSEQMAAELARSLGIASPTSRLLLRAHDEEWQSLRAAAAPLCEQIGPLLETKQSCLVMQFIPGLDLREEKRAWLAENLAESARDLGRLLVLDMLLGNADRLPIRSLGWRGNPSNVLYSTGGACAPIDALVSRRPPRLLVKDEDQKVHRLLELTLLDASSAQEVLLEAVSCNAAASDSVRNDWEARQLARHAAQEAADARPGGCPAPPVNAVKAFHEGVSTALDLALRERGLLEMVVGVIREWFEALKEDMRRSGVKADDWRNSAKPPMKSLGSELLMIGREAKSDERLKESWDAWQGQMQEKTRSLSQAVDDWARDNSMQTALSFRGFIGDSGLNPIVDAYELLVRLEHLVARLRVMADSSQVTRPCDLLPHPLLVGPATAAACFHFMRKQGVVLVLDCTSDLPPPAEAALGSDIRWRRLPLEDAEDQELSGAFDEGLRAIDEAVAAGGRALVHCHEGRSRSVSLCLAYLVVRERMALADAMALVKARRPLARPNAGFWRQLMELELATLGSCSVSAADAPRGKPKAFVCSICGETAGLTEAALAGHMRLKHKDQPAA